MKRLIPWISEKFIPLSVLFFLLFIPLYPKLPLFDIVNTWVYIRFEDLLVAVSAFALLLLFVKKRQTFESPLTYPILLYWGAGLLTLIVSIFFISRQIPEFHVHLALLHFARRIEYMMFFFLGYVAVTRTKSFLPKVVWVLAGTVLCIILYGFGQKFLGFPAFLTMNEEFAKGLPLRLPPTARIPSTFGGHYDLGAYLVFVIPILGSMVFGMKKVWQKVLFFLLSVASLVLLLFTASRISFGVYLIAISAMLVWQKKKRFIIPVIIVSIVILNFVGVASERFYKTFRYENVIVDLSTGKPIGTLDSLEGSRATIQPISKPDEENLPKGSEFIGVPTDGSKQSGVNTVEYYVSSPLATGSGEIATISGSFLIQKAFVYDISLTTRFQGEWPKAFTAFKRNVLTGSGYSTLSVATDGDYLRMLGETGIIGAVAFLGILIAAFVVFLKHMGALDPLAKAFAIGTFAGLIGLMFNAVLIDVFEASKVAFSFWLILGIALGVAAQTKQTMSEYLQLLRRVLTHNIAYVLYLTIFVIWVFAFILPWSFIGDDFTWLKWATQTSFESIPKIFTSAEGFFYRPIPKLWYFVLYSLFWLKPGPYHFMSLVLLSISVVLIYFVSKKEGVRTSLALLVSVLFAVLSVHHENVYWISGQSSLLAFVALFGSIALYQRLWSSDVRFRKIIHLIAVALVFISMLSYDGMMIAPVIIWALGMFRYKQKYVHHHHFILLLVPLYWGLRCFAGAVTPSGDYAYRAETFFVNTLANTSGYLFAVFGGPRIIEYWESLRGVLRTNKQVAVLGGLLAVAIVGFIAAKTRALIRELRMPLVWFLCFLLSLGAYVGLGGMAERYAFIPSGFLVIALALKLENIWRKNKLVMKLVALGVVIFLVYWNICESYRIKEDWAKASQVSEQSILQLRKEYFPLTNHRAFIFVNIPIRYGRAWIFPTGLQDALWHVFRLNPFSFTTIAASSAEEAYSYPHTFNGYNREVLIFQDLQLKRLSVEKKVVEDAKNENK
jgi:O-Antigen ligase